MKWLLVVSVGLNVLLIVLYIRSSRLYHNSIRLLFLKKPHFDSVRDIVQDMINMKYNVFKMEKFRHLDSWCACFNVVCENAEGGVRARLDGLVDEIQLTTKIPCRCSGLVFNDDGRLTGYILTVGYERMRKVVQSSKDGQVE